MTLRSRIAFVVAIAASVATLAALRYSRFYNPPMNPGHGDDGELIAFECIAGAPSNLEVRFETLKEKFIARCSCAALAGAMRALTACCNNQAASAQAACEERAGFEVNCRGAAGGGLFLSGPGNPTIETTFFGGFTRSNWSCVDDGAPNSDLDALQAVFRSCCLK